MIGDLDAELDVNYGAWLPADRQSRILDVGCGSGRVLRSLRAAGYERVLGVDTDADAIAEVERRHPGAGRHITSLDEFCAEHPGCFDVVIARQVVYYFDPLVPALESLRSVLVPGGTFIAEVFNGSTLTGPYVKHKDHRIRCVFTERSLQRALLDAGYAEVRVSASRLPRRGSVAGTAYRVAHAAWTAALSAVYVLERGIDAENPRILSKNLLACARQGAR